jgi:hypothetical protein
MCKDPCSLLIEKFVVLRHKAGMVCPFNALSCRHTEVDYTRSDTDKAKNASMGSQTSVMPHFCRYGHVVDCTIATVMWQGQQITNICLWILPRIKGGQNLVFYFTFVPRFFSR